MDKRYPLKYVADNFSKIVEEYVDTYEKEKSGKTDEILKEISNDFADNLKQVTPRSTNTKGVHLADTIGVEKSGKKYIVYFGKYQIPHLLEFGWTAKNGRRINRTPFIRPLFDRSKEKYVRLFKKRL